MADLDYDAIRLSALRSLALEYVGASDEDRPALAEQLVTGLLVGARTAVSLDD